MTLFSAAFFDIFGIVVFIIILYLGVRLKKKKKVKNWVANTLITVGILGLLVDLYAVFSTFVF